MPTPNNDFTAGQVLTASEMNSLPRGVMAYAVSTTNYTLTTTTTIATDMTVTWTAVAGRYYRISYYEPLVETSTVSGSSTNLSLRPNNAAGTLNQQGQLTTVAAVKNTGSLNISVIYNSTAGSKTFVGCAVTTSTTGTPILGRSVFNPSYLLVEDIGPI